MANALDTPEADYDTLMRASAEPAKKEFKDDHLCYLKDEKENLNVSELRGYIPVTKKVSGTVGGTSAKTLVKVGDLVLSRLPGEVHRARQKALTEKTYRMRTNVRDKHRDDRRKVQRQTGDKTELSTGDIQTEVGRR